VQRNCLAGRRLVADLRIPVRFNSASVRKTTAMAAAEAAGLACITAGVVVVGGC